MAPRKILWVDVETTGLSPTRNGIISIAAFMMVDGVIDPEKGRFVAEMNPVGREIEESALAVNGYTREQIEAFPHWATVADDFVSWVLSHNETFPMEKVVLGGYCTSFDQGMICGWLDETSVVKLHDIAESKLLDVHELAKRFLHPSLCLLPNKKLTTVSKALGVDLGDKAHNAEADILATIEVWKKLVEHDGKRSFL